MHRHQHTLIREPRLLSFEAGGEFATTPEATPIFENTHKLLNGLKNTIAPSSIVETALNKTVLTGFSALNIALLGGVFASGIYMILAGKPPPFLQKLTGKAS